MIDNASVNSSLSSPVTGDSNSIPASPISVYSTDNQFDPTYSGGMDSLAVYPGTGSTVSPDTDSFLRSGTTSAGLSPFPILSPNSRQNWSLIDGNSDMPSEISEGLMDSMSHSVWSGKHIQTMSIFIMFY